MPHHQIRARLGERSDLECCLAIQLLAQDGDLDSHANQLISVLASRYHDSAKILDLLEPCFLAKYATAKVPSASAANPDLLPQLLELNALAVEGWVRLTKTALADLN